MRMGNFAARHSARLIMTGCHMRAATAKAAHLAPERAARPHARTILDQVRDGFDPFVSRANVSMTIVQEITFALLTVVGAVAGSELIVLVWQFLQLLR